MTRKKTNSTSPASAGTKYGSRVSRDTAWIFAILAVSVVMYGPTLSYLWTRWGQDKQYSMAYLVPPICAYFIWKQWHAASVTERKPSVWGLFLLVLGVIVHLLGVVLDIALISDFSIIMCLLGGCLYLRGSQFTRVMWFPLAYTLFAVPVPDGIIDLLAFPMQLYASSSTAHVLQAIGMQVTQDGVNLSVYGSQYQVAEACSGMSSLVALVGVTAVFAYTTRLPAGLRWLLFFLSLPIALIANTVRITTIALVGYWLGQDAAIHIYHDWSSPIVFTVSILLLFLISRGFEWLSARRNTH